MRNKKDLILFTSPKNATMSFIRNIKPTNLSVVVFEWEKLDEYHNYVAFDDNFRSNFHNHRLLRPNLKRNPGEIWVSIHFRWGDVETEDPNEPDARTGLGFEDYCQCINGTLRLIPKVSIFVFAENFTPPESCTVLTSRQLSFFNESTSWKRDLDIMSQSQLLIGGQSSFFVLGAHLCQNCTVIHSSGKKFVKSAYETKRLQPHLKSVYCVPQFICYWTYIEEYIKEINTNKSDGS